MECWGLVRCGQSGHGGQGVLCSGMASCGEIWSGEAVKACYVEMGYGVVRQGGQVMVSSGAVSFGRVSYREAVVVRSDVARSDVARPVWAV